MKRRPVVAVIGGAQVSSKLEAAAEALGAGLMERQLRLVTGGRTGVMEAASRVDEVRGFSSVEELMVAVEAELGLGLSR